MEISIKTEYGILDLHVISKNKIIKNIKIMQLPPQRNLLQNMIGKEPLLGIPYIERICPELSTHYNLLYTNALESSIKIDISDNLSNIKKLFLNLEKIKSNIIYFYRNAKIYNMQWHQVQLIHYHEKLLKELEKITGRRYMPSMFTPGGLNLNLSLGKIKTLKDMNFLLDAINIYLNKFIKELTPFNKQNMLILENKVYSTEKYIQNYIEITNQKIETIKEKYIRKFPDTNNIEETIDSPRGNIKINLDIKGNSLKKIKLKTPSEYILSNISTRLKESNCSEIRENIEALDISLLEVLSVDVV